MMMRSTIPFVALGLLGCLLAPTARAQTLIGIDGAGATYLETSATAPGAPCGQPNPMLIPIPYAALPPATCPPGSPMLFGFPPPPVGLLGDVAVNTITDTVFLTDGVTIGEYVGDPACGTIPTAGTLLNTFLPPFPMGPITGMGMDSAAGILWVTDGAFIGGILPPPPGLCGPAGVAVAPFLHALPPGTFGVLTDLTWYPVTGSLFACDSIGMVHNILVGGAPGPLGSWAVAPGPCFAAGAVLTGIAFDRATPSLLGSLIPRMFITDGTTVAYLDIGGAPSAPPGNFYAPTACSLWPGPPTSGLAMASRGVSFGAPRVGTTLGTFGQSILGSGTFGIEISGTAPGTNVWVFANYSFPGPGYFCPALGAGGTKIYVDPASPGILVLIGPLPPGCFALPTALPAAVGLAGLNVFVQAVDVPFGGLPALDASQGLVFTLAPP